MLFSDAAAAYMADKSKRLRASTVEGYRSALTLHVLPRWGSVDLADVRTADIQEWVDGFALPGAAEKAYKTLRQVIRWSIRRLGLEVFDPTSCGVELPRKPPHRPLAVEAGVGIEAVAMMLGHTGISTAYEHYIVPRRSICRQAQGLVEKLIMEA